MRPEDLTDDGKLRRAVAETHTKVFGDWIDGKWEPGLANFVEEMRTNTIAAKAAADAAKVAGATNLKWLVGVCVGVFGGLLLEAAKWIAEAHGAKVP